MNKVINKIKKFWNDLTPEKKKKLLVSTIVLGVIIIAFLVYNLRNNQTTTISKVNDKNEKKDLIVEPDVLARTQYNELQKMLSEQQLHIKELEEKMKQPKEQAQSNDGFPETKEEFLEQQKNKKQNEIKSKQIHPSAQIPVPVGGPNTVPAPVAAPIPSPNDIQPDAGKKSTTPKSIYNEIEIISQKTDIKEEKKDDKKKENMKIYLPPSFMEATLLSGIDAPTSEGAQGHPAPTIIRIKDLAILPNKIKANLKGCFVIAEGYGNLSDERAHLRLTNLSCLSKKGQSVIDQKVKGFVVDSDGKIGLKGKVVAKFGSKIAMSMIAGFFGGIGDALKASSTTTSISALGTTQVIDTHELTKAGVGTGLSQVAKEIQKFYLDLSKQSMPVVEIGAMKQVTLVISEGVLLEIKERDNLCKDGGDECLK